jgi:hypothetical protein
MHSLRALSACRAVPAARAAEAVQVRGWAPAAVSGGEVRRSRPRKPCEVLTCPAVVKRGERYCPVHKRLSVEALRAVVLRSLGRK